MLGLISQRTNLKANHNSTLMTHLQPTVGPNIAKNKSESKSQLGAFISGFAFSWA